MGYSFSFGEPTVHLESMCGSSSSDPSRFLDGIVSCTLFDACGGPSSEQSKKISGEGRIGRICDLTESDAACFSEEKVGPIKEIALENAVTGTDATGLMEETMVFRSQAACSCTEINSTILSAKQNYPVELPSVVSPEVKEELLSPLANGGDISIDFREDYNAKKGIEATIISKDDVGLADASGSHLSTLGCTGFELETPGINMDDSANVGNCVDTTLVSKDKVGQIEAAGIDPPGFVSPCVKEAIKEESSQMEGENANTEEVDCNEEKVPFAKMPKERECKPKPSELIVFTRRNPKRSATHAESDLNIDRLTRISNRGRKSRKDKEIFDPALLVSLVRDPNLTTKKRKPSNQRFSNSVWGEIKHLSHILDISFQHFKLKQEKEVQEKKNQIALGEKMDGKNIISNQFVTDVRQLKQEGILDRDVDSTLTHERSSMGHEIVQRAITKGETADPGSSPDSVVYNPVSCEANPVLLQCKQSSTSKKKKKNKGENAKPSKRGDLLNVSGGTNQGILHWFQKEDKKGKSISDGKKKVKAQKLIAPGVSRKETGNISDPYNGVTIASHSGSIASNGTREPFRHGGFLEQLLLPLGLLSTPVPLDSVSAPTQSVLIPNSAPVPGQSGLVPELPRPLLPVHMQPISSSLRPFHVPPNSAAASGNPMQVKAHLPVQAPLQLEHAPAQPVPVTAKPAAKPRVAWVCCDECGKWRCIPAELADVIDETNCRWTCKDNADKAFADCSIPQEKSNAEINAELEISDASGDEGLSGRGNGSGDVNHMKPLAGDVRPHSTKSSKKALGPAPYTPLKTNLFLHRNRRSQTIDEIMVCNCKPPENGGMGCRSQCLNRILSIECIRGMCPCGDHCSNQQFQRRNYAKLMYFRSGKKGYGLQLLEDVPAGRFLIEYVGEVLDMASYEARQKEYASRGQKHFYFMTLNGGEVIDACAKGNLGRFINHSCNPNCRTEKWIVNGEVCIGLFAIRDLKKGEELTFDYNYVRVVGAAAKKCFCGEANCRGYIGGDPSSTDLVVQEDSDEEDYLEPVTAKQQERKEPIQKAAIATSSDNSLKKHPPPNKSRDKFGLSAPFVQKDSSVEVHNLGYSCKPDSAVRQLANGPMDKALAVPANSQQAFGLLPRENFSQSVIHPEISLGVSNSRNREKSRRHKTDTVLTKPSDSQGASGSVNEDALSRVIISAGNCLEISKSEYRDDISQCKPDSVLSLPANSHEGAGNNGDLKDVSCSSSSSIAVSSYSLLKLHLSRVKSLGEFKMGERDGSSQPLSPGTSFPNNSVNEYKPAEKVSLLEGLPDKSVLPNKTLEKCELVDREKLCQPPREDGIHGNNFPYDICAANKEVDDVSTPVLPDHSIEEQELVDVDMDNFCESPCTTVSPSDGYASVFLPVPEHHNLPNENILSEEDAARTPVHVTRYLSDKTHTRLSGGMEADKKSSKASSYNKPCDSFDVQLEPVDVYLNKVDQRDRPLSPSIGISSMKTVSTDATDEGVAICKEVKEMVHNTATLDFEGVEEKLNELLDHDGSISRRKHATKGYLKLLIVTAAAGDTGTSQRLKDLSLILDALLKTKSYTVLMDIMKTNGLQMLHTILKQNRDDYNRIPIIRKLLKVLGHLGDMGILTVEQMNQGPPRPGMESFRESIYKLTKHENNKVHQIAFEFFNRWMPKSMRGHNSFAHACNPSTTSKRKSRWDHLSDSRTQDPDFASYNSQAQEVERPSKRPCSESLEEDAPPGFEPVGPPPGFGPPSPPGFESVAPPGFGSVMQVAPGPVCDASPVQVALGYRQEKYRPGISVSYGIPAVTAQNLGVFVQSEGRVFWGIAPGIPFQPFPPLPPCPIVGDGNVNNNRPGFCNDRSRRRWGSNVRNRRRFSRPCNNNEYACDNRRRFSRCGKDWPKRLRDRR